MRFSLLTQAFALSLAAFASAEDSCDDGPYAPGAVSGQDFPAGPDDHLHCVSRWKGGETLIGIRGWSTKYQINALTFKFTVNGKGGRDGVWTDVFGLAIPDSARYWKIDKTAEWDAEDQVTVQMWNMKLWKPSDGSAWNGPGKIVIMKDGQEIFHVGQLDEGVEADQIPNLANQQGIGKILGVKLRSGDWINTLEFKMQKASIVEAKLVQIDVSEDLKEWNTQPAQGNQLGIESVFKTDTYTKNPNPIGGPNLTYTFTNSMSKDNSKTITDQTQKTITGGLTLTYSAKLGIPDVIEASTSTAIKFEYAYSTMNSESNTVSNKADLSYTIGSPVGNMIPPQRAVHCHASATSGSFNSDYTGLIDATFPDGSVYQYYATGHVSSVGYMMGSAGCLEIDLKDVPLDSDSKDGDPLTTKRGISFFA